MIVMMGQDPGKRMKAQDGKKQDVFTKDLEDVNNR